MNGQSWRRKSEPFSKTVGSNGHTSWSETHTKEFKESIIVPKDMVRYIVGFLNGSGGQLIFGVADNGFVVGVETPLKDFDFHTQLCTNPVWSQWWDDFLRTLDTSVRAIKPMVRERIRAVYDKHQRQTDGQWVIVVRVIVPKSQGVVYEDADGDIWVRREASTECRSRNSMMSTAALHRLLDEKDAEIQALKLELAILEKLKKTEMRLSDERLQRNLADFEKKIRSMAEDKQLVRQFLDM